MADFEDAIREAYAAAPSGQVILSTIELNHSTMAAPVRMVRDKGTYDEVASSIAGKDIWGHRMTLEADAPVNPGEEVFFQSVMFKFTLAAQSDARISSMDVNIDNATKIISSYLDDAVTERDPMTLIYREFLTDDTSSPSMIIGNLTMLRVTATNTMVRGTAEFKDLVNKKFPNKVYRPEEFLGLMS
jgi:hypothetical protein